MSGLPPVAELERAAAGLDRRGFLRLAAAAAAAGLLPTGCGGPGALGPPEGLALRVLSPRTYAAFNAAAARIVGPAGAALIGDRRVDPARRADAWLAGFGPVVAGRFQSALLTLEFGVWPVAAKLRPFSALAPGGQDAVLADLMRSAWSLKRQLFAGVKTLACLTYYADPASHAAVGYPGPFGRGAGGAAAFAEAMRYPVGR